MTAAPSLSESASGVAGRIQTIVRNRPAIHFRGLKRAADVSSNGQLRHHINQLERDNMLMELEDGGYTRFFITGQHPPELRRGLTRFARRVPRVIARLLLGSSMIRTDLRQALGCADSTLGYHLNRMLEQGDIQRDRDDGRALYSLTAPDLVRRILAEFGDIDEGTQNGGSGTDDGPDDGPTEEETTNPVFPPNPIRVTPGPSADHVRMASAPVANQGERSGDEGRWD